MPRKDRTFSAVISLRPARRRIAGRRALSCGSVARPAVRPAPAARLVRQADIGDDHLLVDGLAHIVDSQGSHRNRRQGLHFGSSAARGPDPRLDVNSGGIPAGAKTDIRGREEEGVA